MFYKWSILTLSKLQMDMNFEISLKNLLMTAGKHKMFLQKDAKQAYNYWNKDLNFQFINS